MSSERIAWLQGLLSERFRLSLVLSSPDTNRWEISLPGSEKKLELARCDSDYPLGNSDIPFVIWPFPDETMGSSSKTGIPAPGRSSVSPAILSEEAGAWRFNYDVLGLAWWMLSRAEEIGRRDLDCFGRFPAESSHAVRHNYIERPVVDEWLIQLAEAMKYVWPSLTIPKSTFSLLLSHDVDRPSRYAFAGPSTVFKRSAADMVRNRSVSHFLRGVWLAVSSRDELSKNDPLNTFGWIMSHSERLGVESTFYFLCGNTNSTYDADYDLGHPMIRKLLREIHDRGHRIGLHPSFDSYLSPEALRHELATLREVCTQERIELNKTGCRMHYLKIEVPATLRYLAKLGLEYDSTLGYAQRPGFRCGTCHEYQAFDAQADQIIPIRVRPLIAMDVSFFPSQETDQKAGQQAFDLIRRLQDECRRVGGVFTLLWHNSELVSAQSKHFYQMVTSSKQ